jgi:hypothetical protein
MEAVKVVAAGDNVANLLKGCQPFTKKYFNRGFFYNQ